MPAAHIAIRRAEPADAPALAALARRVFAATYGAAIPPATLEPYLAERFAPRAVLAEIRAPLPLLLAEVGGALAGYARLDAPAPPACVGDGRAVELAQLYVDAGHQGRGVGPALLARALAAAGGAPVWLCAWERNERALRFYARHGFEAAGRTEVRVREVVFADLVLVRSAA